MIVIRRVVDEDEERINKQGARENEHDLSASRRRVVAMM